MRFFRAILSILLVAAIGTVAFAAGSQQATAPDAPLTIKWAGLPVRTGGGYIYPADDSAITRALEEKLDIRIEIVKASYQVREQMNLLFASGEIPDHWLSSPNDFLDWINERLIRQFPASMVEEHAPAYLAYMDRGGASEYWHELASYVDENTLQGLPNGLVELKPVTVIRQDWLANVGAEVPTTLDEFREVARLLREGDPNRSGKQDTYAFSLTFSAWGLDLGHIFASFGYALPNAPVLGSDGTVTFFNITDNMRDAIRYIRDLYQSGYIYPDFTIPDKNVARNLLTDGIVGMASDTWTWLIPEYRQDAYYDNLLNRSPSSNPAYIPPLESGSYTPTWQERSLVWTYHNIGRNTDDAKLAKILQLINIQLADPYYHNLVWSGIEGEHFFFDPQNMRQMLPEWAPIEKQGELGTKYFLTNNRDGDMLTWSFGETAKVIEDMQRDWNIVAPVLGYGAVLQTERQYGTDVNTVFQEYLFKAITGDANTESDWNAYVAAWKRAGGDRMIAEANEIYQSRQ